MSVQTFTEALDRRDARGEVFSEEQLTLTLPVHGNQRLTDVATADQGAAVAVVAVRPAQLFTLTLDSANPRDGQTVRVTDLRHVLPSGPGVPSLAVADLSPALAGMMAVYDALSSALLLVDPAASTVTALALTASAAPSSLLARARARVSLAASSSTPSPAAGPLCGTLARDGILVFPHGDEAKVLVVDVVKKTLTTIDLPCQVRSPSL